MATIKKDEKKTVVGAAKKVDAAKKPAAVKKASAKPAAKKEAVKKAVEPKKDKKISLPEKFTVASMTTYIADLRDISKKDAKDLLDSVFHLVESGVMAGERVPVGNMGKLFVKIKPATKARLGRNPLTGEAIKIAAKKATKVPKFNFNKSFKESILKAKLKNE